MKLLCALMMVLVVGCMVSSVFAEEPVAAPAVDPAVAPVAVQDVESSMIKSVAYDPATSVLTVVFVKDGETYEYAGVPEDLYKGLMAAESKGAYFIENIKGKFDFTKK